MAKELGGLRKWCAWGVVAACVAAAIFAPEPDRYQRSAVSFHDFLHVPAFTFVTAGLYAALPAPRRWGRRRRWFTIGALAVMLGVAVELAQRGGGGAVDFGDIVRDGGGTAAAMLLSGALDKGRRLLVRWSLGAAALVLVAAFLAPTIADLVDEALARRQFPVLADFVSPSELGRFQWSSTARASIASITKSEQGRMHALRLELKPGPYPGLSFKFFPRDWRGWGALILVCTNPEASPLRLTVRIDDMEHSEDYGDRFNRSFDLAPGRGEIRIPLREVETAPDGRPLDLGRVRSVVLFAYQLQEERELLVNSLRLAR